MKGNLITVKIADFQISKEPDILRTVLGSCIGICLYDKVRKTGGLAHIMLPSMIHPDGKVMDNDKKKSMQILPSLCYYRT